MEHHTDIINRINNDRTEYGCIDKSLINDEIARHALYNVNISYAVKDIKNYTIDDWVYACKLEGCMIDNIPNNLDYDTCARASLQDHHNGFNAKTVILSMTNPTDNDWINAVMCDGILCEIMPSHLKSDKIYSGAIASTFPYTKAIFLMEHPDITDWAMAVIRDKMILKKLPDEYKTREFVELCKKLQNDNNNINYCNFEIDFSVDNMITTTTSFNYMEHINKRISCN